MQKKLTLIIALVISVFACTQIVKKKTVGIRYFCNTNTSDSLCPGLPYDVNETFGFDYNTGSINFTNPTSTDSAQQTPLDLFSWQTFVALNWPADGSGNPTGNIMDSTPNKPRVWEYYTDPAEVFNDPQGPLVLHLKASKQNSQKFFYMFSKAPHSLTHPGKLGDFREADGNPLIDRNGNFTVYEIKIHPVEVNFITKNNLTTTDGIFKYNPAGFTLPKSDSATKTNGAIEIKASWRILTDSDNASLFYCRMADIYVDSLHTDNRKTLVVKHVKVGLVGMHIIRSTSSTASNFLIWSTFEHIDNAPQSVAAAQNTKWSYYNQACTACTPNTPPALVPGQKQFIWDTVPPYAKFYTTNGFGTQVVRLNNVFSYTDTVNNKWQAKLQNSVWANYKLIGTQWQVNTHGVANNAFPRSMSNTTMETFMQDSSCINCHGGATVTFKQVRPDSTYNIPTGMSFLFPVNAKPQQGLQVDNKK